MTNQSAKEQVREILTRYEMSTNPHLKPLNQSLTPINHEEALSQIEEIVMGVIGNQTIYNMAHEEGVDPNYVEGYNNMAEATRLMRAEQLKRWSD